MKLDIRLLIPGLAFDPADPLGKSLGGSETAGVQLSKALADLGHRVTCFASVDRPAVWNGVSFAQADGFGAVGQQIPADLTIVQRSALPFAMRLSSKVNFLWVHDLLLARRLPELMGSLHSIDRIVTVSQFQAEQHRRVAKDLPESLFTVARNGIDLDLIEAARRDVAKRGLRRDRKRIVLAARPERGMDVLLQAVFPQLLRLIPDATLTLCGYDCPNPALAGFYQQVQQAAASFGDRVTWAGALSKAELYRLYLTSGLYLYPTPSPGDPSFSETSCISAMEAMACGLPVITSNRGALPETVGNPKWLVDLDGKHALTERAVQSFVEKAVFLLTSEQDWSSASAWAMERGRGFGWREVAEQVVAEALSIMREQCSDPVRLARHFIRRQDLEAARKAVETGLAHGEREHATQLAEIKNLLDTRYGHAASPEALSAYYAEQVGPGNGHVASNLMQAPAERFNKQPFVRFETIDSHIRRHFELPDYDPAAGVPLRDKLRILDFGCAQGECTVTLANRLGARAVGVDASPDEVARAEQLAAAKAKRPSDLTFFVGDELTIVRDDHPLYRLCEEEGPFDVLVMAEVLEHLADPYALVERLERLVQPGGLVVITVPFGPWETQQPEPLRGQHLREWDPLDIEDIFGRKAGLVVDRMPLQHCPVTGEILGNTFIAFTADHEPVGRIDWARKLATQRPRQTLSACMILGGPNSHQTLHWCLEPVSQIADEIVIGDAGMSEEARRIAASYGAKLVPAPNPLEVGFETPRNAALAHCTGDWVLMIDGDERLLSPLTLWRYLRQNIYHSYAIPQHHFAVDAAWKPDLPGRLFRRGPDEQGRVLRFVGHLHEHPEFGPNQGAGRAVVLQDVRIAHVGYLDQNIRSGRFVRNLPLLAKDLQAYPDRKLGLMVLMRDSVIQAKWLLAQAGVDISQLGCANALPQAVNLCRDVIKVWERTFADDSSAMAADSMEFYSDACRMLGTDVVGEAMLGVQRQGIGTPVSHGAAFFASVDHYQRFLAARTKALVEPLAGEGF